MKKMFNKLTSAIKSMINGQKRKHVEPEPVCGGVTDKSDPNAPKEILSKDIVEFYAVFYLHTRQIAGRKGFFAFSVKADEGGVLETTEEHSKTVCVADRSLMAELQAVIDKNELALKNGVYRVTWGLPPEYGKCILHVKYASGETLDFTVNNDPTAQWAEMVYDVFADCFFKKGIVFNIKSFEE